MNDYIFIENKLCLCNTWCYFVAGISILKKERKFEDIKEIIRGCRKTIQRANEGRVMVFNATLNNISVISLQQIEKGQKDKQWSIKHYTENKIDQHEPH